MTITNDKEYAAALERAERLSDVISDEDIGDRLLDDLAELDMAIAEYERKHLSMF